MADKKYTDRNGAAWLIITDGNGAFFGTPDPAQSARRYDPVPPDTDVTRAEGAAAALIEKYAAAHRSELTLAVTARAEGGALVLLLLAAVALYEMGKGKRR